MSSKYKVKDISLADQGERNIAWAESQMGALLQVRARFQQEKPFRNLAVGMALHVTKETAVLARTLQAGGASIALTGCNPLSTQDDVAAALAKSDINIYAWRDETTEEYYRNLDRVIQFLRQSAEEGKKLATIDDGCDLISLIHQKHPDLIPSLVVGTEETTTGVIRLKAMEKTNALSYPVVAVNDNKTKHLFDNYYGTGQSTIDGILRATSVLLAGKRFVVAGYGYCGQGVAKCAAGMGAIVTVTEVDPIQALRARMDGYEVRPMAEAARTGDIFVTATGNRDVITISHMKAMKDGAILANSGHFDVEIDVKGLKRIVRKSEQIRPSLEKFILTENKAIYLCGQGRLVNLACAEGHPSIVMSLSFCGQSLALEYGVKNAAMLDRSKVQFLPDRIDQAIASLQLEAMKIKKDELTKEQEKYLKSWQTGT